VKRKKLEGLLLARAFDPKKFEARVIRAYRERDVQFLSAVVRALSLKIRKRFSLPVRVQQAFEELGYGKLGRGVTKKMIREHVDPKHKITLRHYSQAFRKAGLSWLPRHIPKKDS
jgi:hypothetical protein